MNTEVFLPKLTTIPGDSNVDIGDHLRCDVLLFVAVTSEEKQLKKVAKGLGLTFKKVKGQFFEYFDLGQVGTYQRVMAVRTDIGPFSSNGSAARALLAKSETSATAMISLGMAFGVDRNKQNHGDILVSKIILTYDDRRINSKCYGLMVNIDYRDVKPYFAKDALLKVMQRLSSRPDWKRKVHFGALLTGGARIHCAKFRDGLAKRLSCHGEPVIGGEMEGAGLLSASSPETPIWLIVKGISDFADERRDKEIGANRPLACERAATFVLTALRDFDPELEGNILT
jgi:nucleoside phosphorylase